MLNNSGESEPQFENVLFENNESGKWGGGYHSYGGSYAKFKNTIFRSNTASFGAGVSIVAGDDNTGFFNVRFEDNSGPAIALNTIGGDVKTRFVNSVITDSRVPPQDGDTTDLSTYLIVLFRDMDDSGTLAPRFTQTTIYAPNLERAVFLFGPVARPVFENSILWGASEATEDRFYSAFGANISFSHSIIRGGVTGNEAIIDLGGNLSLDPQFVDPAGQDSLIGTPDDDLTLKASSPAIDQGDGTLLPQDDVDLDGDGDVYEGLPLDLAGKQRVQSTGVDLGPYERAGAGSYSISGRILDSKNNEPVSGALVRVAQRPESGAISAEDGSYEIFTQPGTGYSLTTVAPNYFSGSRTYVDLYPGSPTTDIDFQIDPIETATPDVQALSPDPNPAASQVEAGGTAYRYYRVVDRETGRPLPRQAVSVTASDGTLSYAFSSDVEGRVRIAIPTDDIGASGTEQEFEITTINGNDLPSGSRVQFEVEVIDRISHKDWALRSFGRVGVGLGLGARAQLDGRSALTGKVSLEKRSSDPNSASRVQLWRRARGEIGASVGIGAPLKMKIGVASLEGGVRLGASAFFFGGDTYSFDYKEDLSSDEAAAQYAVWARGNALLVSNNLLRLFNEIAARSVPDAMLTAYESDERGFGGRVYGNASFEAGVGNPRSVGLGIGAGVGGDFEAFLQKRALGGDAEEVSLGVSTKLGAGASAGARFLDAEQSESAGENTRNELKNRFEGYTGLLNAGVNAATMFEVGTRCDDESAVGFFTDFGVEASGNLSALGLPLGTLGSSASRRYDFELSSSILPVFSGGGADPLSAAMTGSCAGNSALTLGSMTFRTLSDVIFGEIGERQVGQGLSAISYEQDSTLTVSESGFEIDLAADLGVRVQVGGGLDFLSSKSAISERGAWLNGRHYPLEKYDTIPDVPVAYKTVVRRILVGVDDAIWNAALTFLEPLLPPYFDSVAGGGAKSNLAYQIGDNGSVVTFSDGAIPADVDSLWAVSWGWWGSSVSARPASLSKRARAVTQANKKALEEAYGMRYGIGGFYELQPAGTALEAPTTLTIHYSEDELGSVDESELAVYWEDATDGKWHYVGGTVDAANNTVSASIDTLRTFTLAPRIPARPFELNPDMQTIDADSSSTALFASGTLTNNDSTVVADGALYTVETDRGRVTTPDADTSRAGIQVAAAGGQITFNVQSGYIPGTATVRAQSVHGRSSGTSTLTLANAAAPPSTQIDSVKARDNAAHLYWSEVGESDLGGYKVYFGTDPSTYDGVAAGGRQSPITIGEVGDTFIDGLSNDSTYYFAVAPYDIAGAEADLSPSTSAVPVDTMPPSLPQNFRPTLEADTLAVLAFTAPGDNGSDGLAYAYEVRYASAPVGTDTSAWWDSATPTPVTQPPSVAGADESVPVRGSFAGETYYAVRAEDEMGNRSPIAFTNSSALPVELTTFEAVLDQSAVHLTWKTASEENNAGFEVQRRVGGQPFTPVGYVEGSGTTAQAQAYQFEDLSLPYEAQSLIYRLKQIDTDGSFEYSPEVEVTLNIPDRLVLHGNYPNPFRERTTIRYELPETGKVRMDVYNILGQRVATLINGRQDAGRREIRFDARRLASGVYFVRLAAQDKVLTEKLTVVQ